MVFATHGLLIKKVITANFKKDGALYSFLCTDTEFDNQTILEYYNKHWPIEIFFKQTKNNLELNTYQVRSTKSIDRLLVLITLTYIYCSPLQNANDSFSQGLLICRNEVKKDTINRFMNMLKIIFLLKLF